jgi:quercetin dioxygenase-like cupin family protein
MHRKSMKRTSMRRTSMNRRILAVALPLIAIVAASSANAEEIHAPAMPLLSTGTTILGEMLHYPTGGPAHVTAAVVTIEPGGRTILHRHGVPMFAYILEGEITVDYGDRGKRTYRKGDAFMEAMDVPHFGADAGSAPVRVLTVYIGAEGAPADVIPAKP